MKLIPRQKWMEEFTSEELWKKYTAIREQVQQVNKLTIDVLMDRFNQTHGVHTYQRMYGCYYDDETGHTHGFDQNGYDGEDLISLDLKQLRYISTVEQGIITQIKWNNDRARLEFLNQYYKHECVYWLKELLALRKGDIKRRAPEVFLFQKDPYSVSCLATDFYPKEVSINWFRNRQEHHEDVDLGEQLPNEDGTFQKTSTLRGTPGDWKQNQYACEVEHHGKTFRKTLTDDQIKKTKL
ncbi:major histocompatibility complex class I-related gene protein-like [Pseudorasbora parva]|uniref:major histocompatibility complex class I-related gene protein-like n=1 Tax=Pseudorasbora parva TaxID=51549 RepID=UPI00351ED095